MVTARKRILKRALPEARTLASAGTALCGARGLLRLWNSRDPGDAF